MECPNCAFQNTPGTPACVRCAGRLDFSNIDVIPLRAPRSLVARRVVRGLDIVGFGARDVGRRVGADLKRPRWLDRSWDGVSPAELLLCVVPGLVQIRRGHRALGRGLLAGWLALLLLALLNVGSLLSSLACLAAVSLHCTAISLLLAGVIASMSIPRRLFVGVGVYLLVFGTIYYPAYWGLNRLVRVVPIASTIPSTVVRRGDVLLAAGPAFGSHQPRRGDIVLYRAQAITAPGVIIERGRRVDRVLGVEGDHVAVRAGVVFLNDAQLPDDALPLGTLQGCADMDLYVGPGQYAILPSLVALPRGYETYRRLVFSNRCVVDADQIEARVVCRIRPWLRAGALPRPPDPPIAKGATP